jgi:GrpB-like predicted nucleotidyltransferase (UPF0157 family)
VERLPPAGYEYVPRHEAVMPFRRFFKRLDSRGTTISHIHTVCTGTPFWREHLAFREALRATPRLRVEYEGLKRALAQRFRDEREAYTDNKTGFIRGVVREWLSKNP